MATDEERSNGSFTAAKVTLRVPDQNELTIMTTQPLRTSLYNSTDINQWPDGELDLIQCGSDKGERQNKTRYDEIGSTTWPVVLLWVDSGRPMPNDGNYVMNQTVRTSCVRAMSATKDSVAPRTNVGHRAVASVSLATAAALLAMRMALL
ncbi:hypothetical protein QBC44DRAFT_311842 [Cladorrhinum sp. PSN332]|nr:hypothetical protein QBC44DRAFT_311842 [Cladorrhinum sp. PSN332]